MSLVTAAACPWVCAGPGNLCPPVTPGPCAETQGTKAERLLGPAGRRAPRTTRPAPREAALPGLPSGGPEALGRLGAASLSWVGGGPAAPSTPRPPFWLTGSLSSLQTCLGRRPEPAPRACEPRTGRRRAASVSGPCACAACAPAGAAGLRPAPCAPSWSKCWTPGRGAAEGCGRCSGPALSPVCLALTLRHCPQPSRVGAPPWSRPTGWQGHHARRRGVCVGGQSARLCH